MEVNTDSGFPTFSVASDNPLASCKCKGYLGMPMHAHTYTQWYMTVAPVHTQTSHSYFVTQTVAFVMEFAPFKIPPIVVRLVHHPNEG